MRLKLSGCIDFEVVTFATDTHLHHNCPDSHPAEDGDDDNNNDDDDDDDDNDDDDDEDDDDYCSCPNSHSMNIRFIA